MGVPVPSPYTKGAEGAQHHGLGASSGRTDTHSTAWGPALLALTSETVPDWGSLSHRNQRTPSGLQVPRLF